MNTAHTYDDLLEFLLLASRRGIMPAATASAFASAVRRVFGTFPRAERGDLRKLDVDALLARFAKKAAEELTDATVKLYARRVRTALDYYFRWKDDPGSFAPRTRSRRSVRSVTSAGDGGVEAPTERATTIDAASHAPERGASGGYQTSFPIRPGRVVTVSNLPEDLTTDEAERIAAIVRSLVIG